MMAPDFGGALVGCLIVGLLLGIGVAIVGYFVIGWLVAHVSLI